MSEINTTIPSTTKRKVGRPKLTEEEKLARKLAKENKSNTSNNNPDYKDTRTDVSETCITYCQGDEFLRFYSTQVKGRNFIKRMLKEHPNECKPLLYDDGECVEISMPPESLWYIHFPTKREVTPDQKEALKERAKKMREARFGKTENTEIKMEDN